MSEELPKKTAPEEGAVDEVDTVDNERRDFLGKAASVSACSIVALCSSLWADNNGPNLAVLVGIS